MENEGGFVSIHPTAIVGPGAVVGRDVEIGPYSVIGPNAVIGDGCKLHHHVTVEGHTTLGAKCQVYPQAILGAAPQDVKYSGEKTTLDIGQGNVFREMVTVHPGTANGGGVTRIGDGNLFLIGCHIAHDCRIGNRCIIANYVQFAGHVHVEDYVNMGGHCAVHHFVTVGKHAFVGGMTRVSADVPPYMVVVAARGSRTEVRMVNGVGLERSGLSQEDIAALKSAYMHIFARRARLSGVGICDRVQSVLDENRSHEHVVNLCEFLLRSFAHGRHGRYLESLRVDPVHRNTWTPNHKHKVTVTVEGRGRVQQMQRPAVDHHGVAVELTATPDPGWGFDRWNGGLSGRDNPVRILLDGDKNVTATFVQHTH